MATTQTKQITVERFSVASSQSFETVVASIEREIGHPEMSAFGKNIAAARTLADLEAVVKEAIGPSGLMEFARYDIGGILRKERVDSARPSLRLVMGNPVIMKEMAKHVPMRVLMRR
jgi:hypothetical protein